MPETRTANDERQFHHLKQSSLVDGRAMSRADAFSTRSLSQQRREEGRTYSRRKAGTGNPRAPLEERSKDELYNLAEESGIKGRSRMNKTQLITAIRRRNGSDL